MQNRSIERNFFFAILIGTLIFTFFIFKPFWIVLVLGISFSIVLFPLYQSFLAFKMPDWVAALITILFFLAVLCGPLFFIGTLVFNQSQDLYHTVLANRNPSSFIHSIGNSINQVLPPALAFNVNDKVSDFVALISKDIAKIFSATIFTAFSFVLMLLSIFYFLKDGRKWKDAIITLTPMADQDCEKIIVGLSAAVQGVMQGYLLIALVQGLLMGIGLFVFGVPNPALWGVVAAVASLIPTIGTSLISIPAIIFLFYTGNTGSAIGLLIWATILVGMIDNLLSPLVVGRKINISPLLMLFSVLGGVALLGPIGLLVGPLTISLLYTLVAIYKNEFVPIQTIHSV